MAEKAFKGSLAKPPNLMLSVDPGKSTGWTVFKDGVQYDMGICRSVDEFDEWLDHFEDKYGGPPNLVVYESFILFKNKAQAQVGSKMETSQVIGLLKRFARHAKSEIVAQPSHILPMAIKWSKIKLPGDHKNSHHYAALNHGIYYLVKNNMALPNGMKNG